MFIDQYLSLSSSSSFTLFFICSLSFFLHGVRILVVAFEHIWGAHSVFEEMSRDEDFFNSLVSGFWSNLFYDEVLVLFEQMLDVGLLPSLDPAFHVIMACGGWGNLKKGSVGS